MRTLLALTKVRVSLFAGFSTLVGFVLARRDFTIEIILPTIGVFLLASGACALNQYQERENDQRMERTLRRPLPHKDLSPPTALKISIVLLLSGSFTLYWGAPRQALGLGLFAVLWYNGLYTFLKRRSAFAAIPGALVGAIPPAVGWISGRNHFSLEPQILAISFFFFMWQVPHFWLLLLRFRRDYEKSEFPSLTRKLTSMQLGRVTFIWIFGTAVACLTIPTFGLVESQAIFAGLSMAGAWLIWRATALLKAPAPGISSEIPFHVINSYILLVMIFLSLDPLFC